MKAFRLVFPWFLSVSLMVVLAHPLPAQQAAAPAKAPATVAPAKASEPAAPAVAAGEESTLPGSITFGLHFGDQDVESFGDVLVPVLMFKSGLLFADVRGSVTDYDEQEMNLGLGYRHLLEDKNMIVGGNVFYDRRTTRYDNTFDQLGLGVEFLSKWVDARVNYYLPEDDAKAADDYVTSDSQVTEQNSHWQAPEGVGHTIQQWGYTVTDTYDVKTLHQFRSYEQALEGFDCEVGGLLPIPVVQDYADVKAFAGYYAFDANVGDDIEGFKGRLEVRPMPSLYLDALYFEDEELFGSHYSVGLRATLPFDLANLSRGRNPFKGALEGFKPGKSQAPFSSRLADMVVRDLHVRTDQTEPEEIVENQQVLSKTQTGHSRQEYLEILFTDVTFVDDDNTSGIENGSWEYPYRVIQDGVDKRIGAMVYVRDAANQYYENVEMDEGLTLWGSGCPIYGRDSRFLGGVYPVVNGGGNGPAITLASHTTLAGFEITQPEWLVPTGDNKKPNGYEMAGIYGYNVTDVDIHCNYIHGSGMTTPGIVIYNNYPMTSFEGWIWNNRIDDVRGDGIRLQFNDIRDVDVTLANNSVTRADGHGLYLDAHSDYDGEGFFLARISGNYSDNARDGVYLNARGYDTAAALFVDTTANNNGSVGIAAYLSADYMAGALFASHEDLDRLDQLVNTMLGGIGFLPMDLGDVSVTDLLGVRDLYRDGGSMQANGNGQSGIAVYQWSDYLNLAAVIGAQTDDNGWGGPDVESDKQGGWGGTYIYQSGYDSYNDYDYDSAEISVAALIRCQANNNHGPGLYVSSYGNDLALGVLMDVTANRNSNCGIRGSFYSEYGAAGAVVLSSDPLLNLVENLTANPLLGDFVSPMDMSFITPYGQVQANGNGGSGININAYGEDAAFAIILDAQANENGQMWSDGGKDGSIGAGIQLDLQTDYYYDYDDDGVAIGIVASTESLMGMIQPAIDEMGLPVDVSDVSTLGPVQANNNAGVGVHIYAQADDSIVGVIGVEALNNGWTAGTVSSKVNGYLGDGIDIMATAHNGDAMVGLADVNASGNNGIGIHADAIAHSEWGEAMIGGVGITANGNEHDGLSLFASSQAPASSYLVLAGVEANNNVHGSGIDAAVYGHGTAAAALQAIEANGNGSKGVWVEVDSYDGDAHVWMGEGAVDDMNGHMNGGDGDLFDLIVPMLPDGGVEANGNGEAGVRINADAWYGGDVLVDVSDVLASGNGGDMEDDNHAGLAILTETARNADITVSDSLLAQNSGNGLRVRAEVSGELTLDVSGVTSVSNANSGVKTVLDAGGLLAADFTDNAMIANGRDGFRIKADSGTRLELFGEWNQARGNGDDGFDLSTSAPSGNRVYDFGGGALGSTGNNSITGNGDYGMERNGAGTIRAENNFWAGNVNGDTYTSGGAIDISPSLTTDPNP